ncbi:hypothetical protein NX059_005605 [Plenodomus lindquistii]|nr:hypothetical protein NX059_005605 [Plenodomus lindquistii]
MTYTYTFSHVQPTPQSLPHLAQRYKALRLSALLKSPGAFSGTYADESRRTDEWWEARLQIPGRETFICAAKPLGGEDEGAEDGEWVAQVTLLGPVSANSYRLPEDAGQPLVAEDEEKWQMLSLYTDPDHRGKRIAQSLCKEVFWWLKERKGASGEKILGKVRVRIMVRPDNTAVLKMYTGLGFLDAGRCTLAEALVANGDGEMVPEGGGGEKYQTRVGLIMVVVLER